MDANVVNTRRGERAIGAIAGFHAPGKAPHFAHPAVRWSCEEDGLFRSDVTAFIIEDLRLLGDLALALTVGRPTLFVVSDPMDLTHLKILQAEREIVLTPFDAVFAPGAAPDTQGLAEHLTTAPDRWIANLGHGADLPPSLGAFADLSKPTIGEFARRAVEVILPSVQHFWQVVGHHAVLAQTFLRTPRMIRVGGGGPFGAVTPTLLFVDPACVARIGSLPLNQSTIVVAPFAVPIGETVDSIFAEFVDVRTEPFHLHEVVTFGDHQGATIGCLYGEYVK